MLPFLMAAKDWNGEPFDKLRDKGLSISGSTAAVAEGETSPGIRSETAEVSLKFPVMARLRCGGDSLGRSILMLI